MNTNRKQAPAVRYRERVYPSIAAFLPALLVFPTLWLALAPINSALGFVVGLVINLAVVAVMVGGSPVIEISDTTLRVSGAWIESRHLGAAEVVPKNARRLACGPELDSRAYLQLQATVAQMVKVSISDENDPTPYWIFSSRNAEEVAALINS